MASKRKKVPKPPGLPDTDAFAYAAFVKQLLEGTITATRLYDDVRSNGKPDFEYDDPNG